MPDPDYKALCAELLDAYAYLIDRYMTAPSNKDALVYRARAVLAQPELCDLHREMVAESTARSARAALETLPEPAPTDDELVAEARKAVDTYPRGSELSYFLHEDSCEYEPMLMALRTAACWGTPVNNIKGED